MTKKMHSSRVAIASLNPLIALVEASCTNQWEDLCKASYLFIGDRICSGYALIFHFIF
jgi:hypothetical protein